MPTAPTTKVTILGPMPRGLSFHVHCEGCADIKRRAEYRGYTRDYAWTIEVHTFREVVEEIFSDFIFANDEEPWETYINEVKVFPCVGTLAYDTEEAQS